MRWIDFIRYYYPDVTEEAAEHILVEETAYPFSDLRLTTYQVNYPCLKARASCFAES